MGPRTALSFGSPTRRTVLWPRRARSRKQCGFDVVGPLERHGHDPDSDAGPPQRGDGVGAQPVGNVGQDLPIQQLQTPRRRSSAQSLRRQPHQPAARPQAHHHRRRARARHSSRRCWWRPSVGYVGNYVSSGDLDGSFRFRAATQDPFQLRPHGARLTRRNAKVPTTCWTCSAGETTSTQLLESRDGPLIRYAANNRSVLPKDPREKQCFRD